MMVSRVVKFNFHLASGLTVRLKIMVGVSAQCADITNLKALVRRLSSGLTVLFVVNGPIMCVRLETILLHVNMYVVNHKFLPHSSILIFIFFPLIFHLFFLLYCL